MKHNFDIYHHEEQLENLRRTLDKDNIPTRSKVIIKQFCEYGVTRGLSKSRIIKYLDVLRVFAHSVKKNFDKVSRSDIERFVRRLEERNLSAWTKHTQKIIIKRFYKWLKGNDEFYPEEVRWLKCRIKRAEMKLPEEGDLVTEKDIETLINVANHPRDKALISCLYESGCRIGEIASLQIKNIIFDEYGTVMAVQGKTGSRKIRLVFSTPYLATWLQNHPLRESKEAPLWINIGTKNHQKPLEYNAIRAQLRKLFKRAKIDKKANPHSFRHARATYLANHLTEFQMNQYFGWIQGSTMPAIYVHLSGKETESAILELNGLKTTKEKRESLLKPKKCVRCDTINNQESSFCSKCGGILDIETAIKYEEARKEEQKVRSEADELMNKLIKDPEVLNLLIKKLEEMKQPLK